MRPGRRNKSGLSPKIPHKNTANGSTTGKGKEREVATSSKGTWGFFLSHNTIPKAFGTPLARQEPSNYAVPDPMAFPVSKSLQTACPMHNT
jgi:hypothetical protein